MSDQAKIEKTEMMPPMIVACPSFRGQWELFLNEWADDPILYEDGEALVVDKPGGLSMDRPRAGGPSLEDHLDELRLGFPRRPAVRAGTRLSIHYFR